MKKSVLIILPLILILSFAFVSAKDSFSEKNKVEDLKQSLLDSGKFENEEDFLGVRGFNCDKIKFKEIDTEISDSEYRNKTDCYLLEHEEIVTEYLQSLVDYEEECFKQARRNYPKIPRFGQKLISYVKKQNDIPPEESEGAHASLVEYAAMSVIVVTAITSIVENIGGETQERISELLGPQYEEGYEYHIQDRLDYATKKTIESCENSLALTEKLYGLCVGVNLKVEEKEGLTQQDKEYALGVIEREVEDSEAEYETIQGIHSMMERKNINLSNWFVGGMVYEPEVLIKIIDECEKLKAILFLANMYASQDRNYSLNKFLEAKESIEDKELSGIAGNIFGEESINIYIIDEDAVLSLETKDKKVSSFDMKESLNPTMNIYMNSETAKGLMDSDSPTDYLQTKIQEEKITYEGVGLGKKVKFGFVKLFKGFY